MPAITRFSKKWNWRWFGVIFDGIKHNMRFPCLVHIINLMVQDFIKACGSEIANNVAIVSLNDNQITDVENNVVLFEMVKKIWQKINNANE